MTGFAGILASLATALVALLAFLGASNVSIAVAPVNDAFGAIGNLISPLQVTGAHGVGQVIVDHETFKTGTSTVCSFKTPANATTTGVVAAQAFSVPFAQVFQLAAGATNNATTTDLGTFTTAGLTAPAETEFGPNTFINVKAATGSAITVNANFAPTGTCTINLTVI